MKRTLVKIAAGVLVLGLVFGPPALWPALHEPADHTCPEDAEGSWSYKIGIPGEWNCRELGWHIGRYGFEGI